LDVRLGDYGEVWWKPVEWLRFDVERLANTEHAGYIDGHWLSPWSVEMLNTSNIFSYFYSGGIGFLTQFTPLWVDGLSVHVLFPSSV
jgi:hypothetical protein